MSDLRALALSVLNRKKLSHAHKPSGTVKVESNQAVNPSVPLSHALGVWDMGQKSPDAGTGFGTGVPSSTATRFCLQCREPVGGPGDREIVARSTGTGQLALLHLDCLHQWLRKGPPQ